MSGSIRIMRNCSALIGLLFLLILSTGCSMDQTKQNSKSSFCSDCKCMTVNGTVLGKLKINTSVALYSGEVVDYKSIEGIINEQYPDAIAQIGANQSFTFPCLPEGHYILNVPASSYNFSVGSPIANENMRDNFKVYLLLQGGNSQRLFSAFSIEHIS